MLERFEVFLSDILQNIGIFGPILASALIIIESIVPILPLFVLITFNFFVFGKFAGFIISWVCTCIGCCISFFVIRKNIQNFWYKHLKSKGLISKNTMTKINNLTFEQLVTIIAIPFTPAFLINVFCGLSKMSFKKYLTAIIIGKIFIVYFWGIIGISLLESIRHPIYLLKVLLMLFIAFILAKVINKKLNIND